MAAALAPGSAAQGLHTWARVVDARDRLDVAGTRYESLPEAAYHGPLEVETGGTWRAHGADAPANQPRDSATSDGGCSRNGGAGGRAQRPMPRVVAKPSARLGSRKGPLTTDPPIRRHQRVAATYATTIASSGGGRRTATSSSSSAAAMTPVREETPPEEGEQKRQRGDAREEASGVHDDVRGASERGDAATVEGGGKGDMPAGPRPGPAIHSIVFDLDQTLFVAAPFQPSCDATGVATWASHTAGASLWSGVSRSSGGGGGGSKQQRGGSRRRYSGGLEVHDIMLSSGDSWRVVLRPGALKLLQEVRQHYKEVVAFTAAEEGYARAVLSVLDPEGRLFDRLHTRKDCSMVDLRRCGRGRTGGCGGGGGGARSQALLKPVLLRHGYHPARTLVLDDNIYSFACNVENGLLLKPFRGDPRDRELEELRPQLVQVARCPDVRRALHRMRVQRLQSRLSCLQKRNPQLSSCTAFQRASFGSAARGGAVLQAFNGELALYELYQSTVPFLAL